MDFSSYRSRRDPFPNLLSRSVFLSKYCRDGESWTDTIRRVVDANCALDSGVTERERELLFDAMWNMKILPPGRGLFSGGVAGIPVMSRYNCFYVTLRGLRDFEWIALRLLEGGGVGVGLTEHSSLPTVTRSPARLTVLCSKSHPNEMEVDPDEIVPPDSGFYNVPDTRQGWAAALYEVLLAAYAGRSLCVNVSSIRPRGATIRTFGGIAPGPGPLSRMLREVWAIVRGAQGRKLEDVECLDCVNHIGACIRSGGVRRSAIIQLGSANSMAFRTAKHDWNAVLSHRSSSNNSILLYGTDGFDWSSLVADCARYGEPGFVNMGLINQTDKYAKGVNPCSEATMDDYEACCLSNVFPSRFERHDDARELFRLITRFTVRQRLETMEDPLADAQRVRLNRIGVGLGGICDFPWTTDTLSQYYRWVRAEASVYADDLGVARPYMCTVVKPDGCRPGSAFVTTQQGIYTLDELSQFASQDDWSDISHNGFHATNEDRLTKFYRNGVRKTLRIRMVFGLEVESTPNHMWSVAGQWKRTDKIEPGDVIDIEPGVYRSTASSPLLPGGYKVHDTRVHQLVYPSKVTPDLAWFLGYLWGNGCMSDEVKGRIRFVDNQRVKLEKVANIVNACFGLDLHGSIFKRNDRDAYTLEFASIGLHRWLVSNGFSKYNGNALAGVPRRIRESSREDIIAFLAGLIDSDGCVSTLQGKRKVILSTRYDDLSTSIQHVALAVGLVLGRSLNTKGVNLQKQKYMWLMSLAAGASDRDSLDLLERHSIKVNRNDSPWGTCQKVAIGTVKVVEDGPEVETYDVEVENSHWFHAGAIKSHNTISSLVGTSSGVHAAYAPFYIRRIRIMDTEPMAAALMEAGVPHETCVYDTSGHTYVFSIPMRAQASAYTHTETVETQIKRVVAVQESWADQAVSTTVSVGENETGELTGLLAVFGRRIKALSMLPRKHSYAQAPYEEISREEYEKRVAVVNMDHPLTYNDEAFEMEACEGGACPVR